MRQPPIPATVEALTAQLTELVAEAEEAAHDFGIRWREPEGLFVRALLDGLQLLNAVSVRAETSFAAAAQDARLVAEGELRKVRELALLVENSKHQARAVAEVSKIEHLAALRRMFAEAMPPLIEEVRQAVVIREQSWNRSRARASVRSAGMWTLGIFLAGFGLCMWMQWNDSAMGARCRSNLVSQNGRTYCLLSLPQASTELGKGAP